MLAKAAKLAAILRDDAFRDALRHGVAAAVEHHALVRKLDIGTLVDVGANVGQFSLVVRREHPEARIIAFEPLPSAAERYRRLFKANCDLVTLHEAALGPSRGSATIHMSRRDDSSS